MWRLGQVLLLLLLSSSLGQAGPLRSQIIGGHPAKPHSRPYMAALTYGGGSIACGGFLVAPQWVMTAAHCMDMCRVILGAHNIHNKESSQQVFSILASYPHPDYDKENQYANDIRLLKLNSTAKLNKYVQILRLPKYRIDVPNWMACTVAGWGDVDEDFPWAPATLYETNVTISDCSYDVIHKGKICTRGPYKPYKGDSGGPLVCNGLADGIVSYLSGSFTAFYTRIGHYVDWIEETMKL